jgi:hypothetical protein
MGSFDFVRLAPHFAQDDSVISWPRYLLATLFLRRKYFLAHYFLAHYFLNQFSLGEFFLSTFRGADRGSERAC